MQIIVASTNPVKIDAVRQGFAQVFPKAKITVEGIKVASGVSDQPLSDDKPRQGAHKRAQNARRSRPGADFWVGIEGGLEEHERLMHCFAWMVVQGPKRQGIGRTATFILPEEVSQHIRAGYELGDADDMVFGQTNSKQQNGSVGLLTGDRITRTTYYVPAVVLALIPFLQPQFNFTPSQELA